VLAAADEDNAAEFTKLLVDAVEDDVADLTGCCLA